MKIIQIGSYPLDVNCIKGGVESSIYGLSLELVKAHTVVIVDVPRLQLSVDKREELANGMRVYRYAAKGNNNISTIRRCESILSDIKQENPNVCHIHGTGLFSYLLWRKLNKAGLNTIVTVHGLLHIEKRNLWRKQHAAKTLVQYIYQSLSEFIFLSGCSSVIVDTPYVADTIQQFYKQHKIWRLPHFIIIPQGINPVFYFIEHQPKKHLIVSIGAIGKRKGHLQLLEAFKVVLKRFSDAHLIIAGTLADSDYLQQLTGFVAGNGMADAVEINVNASFENILAWYSNAEVFALHSEEESQGIVFAEAMAVGLPIVATNVGGIPWVVENNVNGLLSDFGNIDTFANNLIKVMHNDSLRKNMQEANQIKARNYDWKLIAKEITDVY